MLKGKVALITGGSRGIGRAIALKYAENGADIAFLHLNDAAEAAKTADAVSKLGVRVAAYECDVADFEAVKTTVNQVIAELGGIDILVNNAGITRDGLLATLKEADFDAVVDINLKGVFNTTKHCYMHFAKKKAGKIINISSISGLIGNLGQANYAAAKAGVIALTKTVARELASRNICCNAIAPGFIATDMTQDLPGLEQMLANIPFGRIGQVDDVAELALFLASDKANYITGEVIRVDGGMAI